MDGPSTKKNNDKCMYAMVLGLGRSSEHVVHVWRKNFYYEFEFATAVGLIELAYSNTINWVFIRNQCHSL